jgi:hypothetical protein
MPMEWMNEWILLLAPLASAYHTNNVLVSGHADVSRTLVKQHSPQYRWSSSCSLHPTKLKWLFRRCMKFTWQRTVIIIQLLPRLIVLLTASQYISVTKPTWCTFYSIC